MMLIDAFADFRLPPACLTPPLLLPPHRCCCFMIFCFFDIAAMIRYVALLPRTLCRCHMLRLRDMLMPCHAAAVAVTL